MSAAASLAPRVLLVRRDHAGGKLPRNVMLTDPVPIADCAGRLRAAVTHGGMGLVASLALARVPHLIVPGDATQAVAALIGERLGFAAYVGLSGWTALGRPGRLSVEVSGTRIFQAMRMLLEASRPPAVDDGLAAVRIARLVASGRYS